ncbi:MAG TPA: ACT domain-containing protein [Thermoleophilaceae bacterium]|nr:ACT domain-containing protein [Thermoleophilaceae bacterium]
MPQLALSAVGRDRPGIVAATTAVLLRHGVNVEDSRMSILRGHFAMTLILGVPDGGDRESLAADLDAVAADLGLEALALSAVEPLAEAVPEPTHVVSIYGVDHPGIVHHATRVLAEHRVNITDLETRLVEGDGSPSLYALLVEVAVPEDIDPADVDGALAEIAASEVVEVTLRELESHEL